MQGKYIIIAGTNKAGTTSFFEYLAAHPSVCPAYIKQTFFFLDKSWQHALHEPALFDYAKGSHQYRQFFRNYKEGQLRLEASPEYLYAPGTPARIHEFAQLHDVQLVFILRNPVTRFISLFHFGKQQGIIDTNCSFGQFLEQSRKHTTYDNASMMAYETGFYSKYLERYVSLFGKDKLLVYFFEDFMSDTQAMMQRVCRDLSLDAAFYEGFVFETHNKTITVKNRVAGELYKKARLFLIQKTFKSRIGHGTSMLLKKTITPIYRRMNTAELKKDAIPPEHISFLEAAYKDEKETIAQLLGIKVPW